MAVSLTVTVEIDGDDANAEFIFDPPLAKDGADDDTSRAQAALIQFCASFFGPEYVRRLQEREDVDFEITSIERPEPDGVH